MASNYEKIILQNLTTLYRNVSEDRLQEWLPARKDGLFFDFNAFGEPCRIGPEQIALSEKPEPGPRGLVISLYCLHANAEPAVLKPFKSFKEFPDSAPYHGAFEANAERPLISWVPRVKVELDEIARVFSGRQNVTDEAGDFSVLLFPLPKIALCYIFYLPDEDFPASVKCLFSANARRFMPLDGLADVAEYTTRKILELV